MSQEGKFVLESVLGKLLGFDEGAGDLLNHLLTIESEEDLKEYLSQLLGSETPETQEFVMNLGRYQRGEDVLYSIGKEVDTNAGGSTPASSNQAPQARDSNGTANNKNNKKAALQARKNGKKGKQSKVLPPSNKAAAPQSTSSQSSTAVNKPAPQTPSTTAAATPQQTASASAAATTQPPPPVKKSIPTRGKAKFVCGCMGNRDKPLTNCLYCGRIVCEREGYGHCPYCGYLIEEIIPAANGNDASWAQKERLLRFDREFARRTKIFDDQADFQGPATWMSEEERAASEQKQMERLEDMRRPKQVMNLDI